jgi:hypothetical protein
MKRTWGLGLLIVAIAFAVGACAHIYDDGIGEGRYDRVTITHPQNGAQISDDDLDVEGTSTEGSVQVAVFDPYDRLVTRTRLAVRDGRWATSFNLHDGRYRIRVSSRSDEDRDVDEIRVTYRDESLRDGSGWGGRQIAITVPRNGEVVNAGTLDVQGTSAVRRVRVQLFDDAGRMVQSVSPDVVESRWRARFEVPDGRYWVRASRPDGTEGDEVRITYRGSLAGGGGVPGEDRVAITYPQDGSIVNAGALAVEGTSADRNVRVQVYDVGGRMVEDASVAVREGHWSTTLDIRNGRYRIEASTPGDRDEVRITYRGEYGDGGR